MTEMADTVFLFDVDNTLLDNDRVQADLGVHLAKILWRANARPLLGNLREAAFRTRLFRLSGSAGTLPA